MLVEVILGSTKLCLVRMFDQVRPSYVRLGHVCQGNIKLGQVMSDYDMLVQIKIDYKRLGQVMRGYVNLGQVLSD